MSIKSYIKETRAELSHVTWPTRKQAIAYTIAVIVISLVVAYLLGAFDKVFQIGLSKILGY
ncbi:MAG: preprotein translocase subunit SecE [Candidatus Pacebacteria bacterium]|nr:preprotein translocase subunit SecE [Candidatus Paceibacterota bacterium]